MLCTAVMVGVTRPDSFGRACNHVPRETHWLPILHNVFGGRTVPAEKLYATLRQVYMAKGRTALERIVKDFDLGEDAFWPAWRRKLPDDTGGVTIGQLMDGFYELIGDLAQRLDEILANELRQQGAAIGTQLLADALDRRPVGVAVALQDRITFEIDDACQGLAVGGDVLSGGLCCECCL